MTKAKQQVSESAWSRAIRESEQEVFRRITGSYDISGEHNEYKSGNYKTIEEFATARRRDVLKRIELFEAADDEYVKARQTCDQANLAIFNDRKTVSDREYQVLLQAIDVWKEERTERERELAGKIPHIDGGRPFQEGIIHYAERALLLLDQALEKLAICREGLKKVTNGG